MCLQARPGKWEVIMLSAFGDESADESKQRVFCVAAIVAPEESWNDLKAAWVDRIGPIPFHATDCDSDHGDYANTSHAENKVLYKDLAQILARGDARGYARVVGLQAYNEHFPGSPRDMTYYWNFLHVVHHLSKFSISISSPQIDFTFDSRKESDGNAGYLYSIFANSPDFIDSVASKVSFECSKKKPEIQMADLFAREAMKELDRDFVLPRRERRKSLQCLLDSNRFQVEIYDDEYFRDFKAKFSEIETISGMSKAEYAKWLSERGDGEKAAPDNERNRMRYLQWKEMQGPK